MIPNRYEQYLDIAGKVAKTTAGQEFITVGAVCILPDTAEIARGRAASLPKWRDCDVSSALEAAQILGGIALAALTLRIRKDIPAWSVFWTDATAHYTHLAQATRAKRAAFTKAANLLRYIYFGECSARLLGEVVRHVGYPTVRDHHGFSAIQLRVVCDTDIQGAENIETFNYLWARLEGNQPLINQLGLSEHVSEVRFLTETEEPILLLADHLAGAIHTTTGPTAVTRPRNLSANDLRQIAEAYRTLPHLVAVNADFAVQHKAIFGDPEFRRLP